MYKIIVLISKLYTLFLKNSFYNFGRGSIIKPFLNTTNSGYIAIGKNVNIGSFCRVAVSVSFGNHKCKSRRKIRLKIGDNVHIGNNAFIIANNNIEIGDNVIMAPYVYISDHIHSFYDIKKNLHDQPLTNGGIVKIGDNVFVGIKASILPNVIIGKRSIIGANAVVTKDVPPYSVVVGNPARIVSQYDFSKREWIKIEK